MAESYPLFREYSLAVRDWLRNICSIPRLERMTGDIVKITRTGTAGGGVNQNEIHLSSKVHDFKAGHTIKLEGTEKNDEHYTVLKVVDNILILDPAYRRVIAEQINAVGKVRRTINIVYAAMDKSIASIAQPLRNGLIDSPGISYYISDYQYKVEKSRPRENYYTKRYKDNNTGVNLGTVRVPPLQEYEVHYSINMWAVYMQEMDILQYQIATSFAPEKFFWIGDPNFGFSYIGDRMNREGKGQWAHALIDQISDASDLEPGTATAATLRTEIGFMITNAYLPIPFEKNQPLIGSIDVETVIEDNYL